MGPLTCGYKIAQDDISKTYTSFNIWTEEKDQERKGDKFEDLYQQMGISCINFLTLSVHSFINSRCRFSGSEILAKCSTSCGEKKRRANDMTSCFIIRFFSSTSIPTYITKKRITVITIKTSYSMGQLHAEEKDRIITGEWAVIPQATIEEVCDKLKCRGGSISPLANCMST